MKLGTIKLKKFIDDAKLEKNTLLKLARSIGCSSSYLLELANGRKDNPSIDMANRIQTITKIKISDWSKDA